MTAATVPDITASAFERVHDELTAEGYSLREESASGSRYYTGPGGAQVRVADHPANARTRHWMANVNRWMVGGIREVRVDQPPYAEPDRDGAEDGGESPPLKLDAPGVGVYPGVPDSVYHAWDVCSNSRLSILNEDPEDCAWAREHPEESKESWNLGTAVHTHLLEPSLFDERHAVFVGDKRSNAQKKLWASMVEKHGEGNILREQQAEDAERMRDAALDHPAAAALLNACAERELSVVYDALGGRLRMKARLDGVAPSTAGGVLVDLKTARDVSARWFRRAVYDRGYFRQAANYRMALRAHGRDVSHCAIVAVQNCPPYKVRVYTLLPEVIDAGERDLRRLMHDYVQRETTANWRGDNGRAIDLDLTTFAYRELEQRNGNLIT